MRKLFFGVVTLEKIANFFRAFSKPPPFQGLSYATELVKFNVWPDSIVCVTKGHGTGKS